MSTDLNLVPTEPGQMAGRTSLRERMSGLGGNARQYGIFAALVVIIVLFEFMTGGRLLLPDNVAALVNQNAYVMVLAIGMVMVIIAGHIDLSVGSVVATVGGIVAISMRDWGFSWYTAIILAIVVGAAIGAWQGFWVAYVGIPAFIVTLAGMLIFRGVALAVVGQSVPVTSLTFNGIMSGSLPNFLGRLGDADIVTLSLGVLLILLTVFAQVRARRSLRKHSLAVEPIAVFVTKVVLAAAGIGVVALLLSRSTGGVPIVLVICAVLIVLYTFIMGRTVFGRHIYAIGGNRQAARLSGVNTRSVDFLIFVNIGALAGITAVVITSRLGTALASAGTGYELDAIAACFIGGAAVTGGIGRISGAIVGALVMGVLNQGLSIMSVDPSWTQVIKGLVLLMAVAYDLVSKRRAGQ
jgi:putative multiple sugar transport system permease protein